MLTVSQTPLTDCKRSSGLCAYFTICMRSVCNIQTVCLTVRQTFLLCSAAPLPPPICVALPRRSSQLPRRHHPRQIRCRSRHWPRHGCAGVDVGCGGCGGSGGCRGDAHRFSCCRLGIGDQRVASGGDGGCATASGRGLAAGRQSSRGERLNGPVSVPERARGICDPNALREIDPDVAALDVVPALEERALDPRSQRGCPPLGHRLHRLTASCLLLLLPSALATTSRTTSQGRRRASSPSAEAAAVRAGTAKTRTPATTRSVGTTRRTTGAAATSWPARPCAARTRACRCRRSIGRTYSRTEGSSLPPGSARHLESRGKSKQMTC